MKKFNPMKNEIEKDTKKLKVILCSLIGKSNIVKAFFLPKVIYWFNTVAIKISTSIITEIEKPILKIIWTHETSR